MGAASVLGAGMSGGSRYVKLMRSVVGDESVLCIGTALGRRGGSLSFVEFVHWIVFGKE